MIRLKAIDLHSHRIEIWEVSIPVANILYLEDVRWRGQEHNYTRIHLINEKSITVCESIPTIEAMLLVVAEANAHS